MPHDDPTQSTGADEPTTRPVPSPASRGDELDSVQLSEGDAFGRYRIRRRLGAGGMGVVFEAEQDRPRRTVALKLIRPDRVSAEAVRRFEVEAEVLGRLAHPGVAQVFEAGVHRGTPYFAMEYLDGQTLTEFAARRELTTRARLEIFAGICDAVHHAHQKGVIHRDLKPANIMVVERSGAFQPKVMDFGVARVTDADVNAVTVQTDVGRLLGTIPYMSPEQAGGDPKDLDVRSDVYTLGVVLFELLAGRRPHDLRERLVLEAVRIICEEDASRLSAFDTSFRGDIETIVAKSLERPRERRYQSAAEMASDLRRYLNDEPIAARPATTAYQVLKFARRNRVLVGGIAATLAALAAGIVVSSVLAVRAEHARRLAETERSAAEALNDFLVEDLLLASRTVDLGPETTVVQLLDQASATLSDRFGAESVVGARLRAAVGRAYLALGDPAQASPLLEGALGVLRPVDDGAWTDPARAAAELALTESLWRNRRGEEAARSFHELVDALAAARGPDDPLTLRARGQLANALKRAGDLDGAERAYREVLAGWRRVEGRGSRRGLIIEFDLLLIPIERGVALRRADRRAEAVELWRATLPAFEALIARTDAILDRSDRHTIACWSEYASLLNRLDRFADAERAYAETIDRMKGALPDRHWRVIQTRANLARLRMKQERFREAGEELRDLVEAYRGVHGATAAGTRTVSGWMAECEERVGRLDSAAFYLIRVHDDLSKGGEPFADARRAQAGSIAEFYERIGRPSEAARWSDRSGAP